MSFGLEYLLQRFFQDWFKNMIATSNHESGSIYFIKSHCTNVLYSKISSTPALSYGTLMFPLLYSHRICMCFCIHFVCIQCIHWCSGSRYRCRYSFHNSRLCCCHCCSCCYRVCRCWYFVYVHIFNKPSTLFPQTPLQRKPHSTHAQKYSGKLSMWLRLSADDGVWFLYCFAVIMSFFSPTMASVAALVPVRILIADAFAAFAAIETNILCRIRWKRVENRVDRKMRFHFFCINWDFARQYFVESRSLIFIGAFV